MNMTTRPKKMIRVPQFSYCLGVRLAWALDLLYEERRWLLEKSFAESRGAGIELTHITRSPKKIASPSIGSHTPRSSSRSSCGHAFNSVLATVQVINGEIIFFVFMFMGSCACGKGSPTQRPACSCSATIYEERESTRRKFVRTLGSSIFLGSCVMQIIMYSTPCTPRPRRDNSILG